MTVDDAVELLDKGVLLALDTETTGIENDIRDGRGYLQGFSLAYNLEGIGYISGYFPIRHYRGENLDVLDARRLRNALNRTKSTLIFHNAKYDLVALETMGVKFNGPFIDTMLIGHYLSEERPFDKKLNTLAQHYLNDEGKKHGGEFEAIRIGYGWINIPSHIMADYAAYDAELTYRLWLYFEPLFKKEELEENWEHKQKFVRLIIEMERKGVRVDVPRCNRLATIGETVLEEMKDYHGINLGSPKGLEKVLIDELKLPVLYRTGTGRIKFDKKALEEYEEILERIDNDIAEDVLTYRGWQKATSSNYKPYVALLSPDGRLRPNYKLHGTKTGRMSCEKPNLQQIPRVSDKNWNGQLKSCFIPEDGYRLWEFDYSQLELRLATAYAKIPELIQVFDDGRDIFDELSKTLGWSRHNTKTFVYSTQYGAGATRISRVFGVSQYQAIKLIDDYYGRYPEFRALTNMAGSKCIRLGKVRLWSGRYRHFVDRKNSAHKAFNSVIQGGAADIMERSMLRVWDAIDDHDECRMLLQVHDSILTEIKIGTEEKYLPLIKAVMEAVEPDFGVKFAVECKEWGMAA
jgi:DNA polymerase-1